MPTTTGVATSFIDFTRASNATVTDSDGKVKWAPHNLLLASESFDAASWTKLNATIGANSVAAPNGTTTADKIIETTANGLHCPYNNSITGSSGTSYTLSVFAKAAERTWITLILGDGFPATNLARASFNLSTGAVGTVGSAATAYPPVDVGNGWWLCRISATSVGTTFGCYLCTASADDTYSYVGDITKGIYIWGTSFYRSDLGGMQPNTSAYPMYNPTTPKNLLGYTEDFSNAAWTKTNIAAFGSGSVSNAIVAPNGLQTADKIVENTGVFGGHTLFSSATVVANTSYTVSVYVKAAERNFVRVINFDGGSNGYGVIVNLSDQTESVVSFGTTTGNSYSVVPAGNGWYRISVTSSMASTTRRCQVNIYLNATTENYTGDGASGIYIWGAQLSDSASLDPYVPVYGAAVTSAAYYGPRRDFDPVTLACKGLLVEEQRANLMTYSDNFGSTGFPTATNIVVAENDTATTSPDGTTNADKLTDNTTNDQHRLFDNYTFTAANAHTLSVYVKRDTHRWFRMLMSDGTTLFHANFDLLSGVVGQKAASVTSSNIIPLSNGWFRVSMTFTVVAALGNIQMVMLNSDSTSSAVSYAGTGTSLWLYGLQIEANASFATSYIPTGAATATRNADVASVSTQAFPYSATEGAIVANGTVLATAASNRSTAISLYETTTTGVQIGNNTGNSGAANVAFLVNVSNVDQAYMVFSNVVTAGTPFKAGGSYKANAFNAAVNGTSATPDTSGSVPSGVTEMRIGRTLSTEYFNGHIRQITYLPRALTASELQTRTA